MFSQGMGQNLPKFRPNLPIGGTNGWLQVVTEDLKGAPKGAWNPWNSRAKLEFTARKFFGSRNLDKCQRDKMPARQVIFLDSFFNASCF
jgi:hypothetical protein